MIVPFSFGRVLLGRSFWVQDSFAGVVQVLQIGNNFPIDTDVRKLPVSEIAQVTNRHLELIKHCLTLLIQILELGVKVVSCGCHCL